MKNGKRFSMVSRTIWRSERFGKLAGPLPKLLYLYFLTCDHQNNIGCYRLPDGYALTDFGIVTPELTLDLYRTTRDEVHAAGLIDFDADTHELLVEKWLENNRPATQKHITGARTSICCVSSDRLREKLEAEFERIIGSTVAEPATDSRLLNTRFMAGNRNAI